MQAYTRLAGHPPEWGVLRVSTLQVGSTGKSSEQRGRTSAGMRAKLQP
jgi:hypothetical protein